MKVNLPVFFLGHLYLTLVPPVAFCYLSFSLKNSLQNPYTHPQLSRPLFAGSPTCQYPPVFEVSSAHTLSCSMKHYWLMNCGQRTRRSDGGFVCLCILDLKKKKKETFSPARHTKNRRVNLTKMMII